jgi:membrane associated rhomboid family serine protease
LRKTNIVILACIGVSVLFWLFGSEADAEYLAFSTDNLLRGRVWTLITSLFMHADLTHLAGNMVFLYVFGNTLEKEVGAGKTMLAFFAGGILSLIAGIFHYNPGVFLVGASAAIFTLTAAVMLVKPLKFSFIFFMPLGLVTLVYIIYNVIAVYTGVEGNVGYFSHVVGFAVGLPLGAAWTKNLLRNLLIALGLLFLYVLISILLLPLIFQMIGI